MVVLFGTVAACSPDETDYQEAAVEAMEGDLGEDIGLGDLSAECDEPEDEAVGTMFSCAAETPDGEEVRATAEIGEDEKVNVRTINVLVAADMPVLEQSAAEALSNSTGADVTAESLDCGDQALGFSAGTELTCGFTDADGSVYDATVTFTGDTPDEGFDVELSSTPR